MKTPLKSTFKFYYLAVETESSSFAELQVRAKIFPKRTNVEGI